MKDLEYIQLVSCVRLFCIVQDYISSARLPCKAESPRMWTFRSVCVGGGGGGREALALSPQFQQM